MVIRFSIALVAFCCLAAPANPALGAAWTQTIDDSAADFSLWDSELVTASDATAVGGSYRYILNWGDSKNASARVFYKLSNVPAGKNLFHIEFSSPTNSTFGTAKGVAQWRAYDVAADGTENFAQKIPWVGQFGTNKQWLGTNSGYTPGGYTFLGKGPQNDDTLLDGRTVWMNGNGAEPYVYIGYQPFYEGPIAFDAIRVTQANVPGDTNLDGIVDGADYTVWADNYLESGDTFFDGDFNGDGIINGGDYTIWADNYNPAALASAVPEPSSLALAGIGALVFLVVGRRRWRARSDSEEASWPNQPTR